MDIYQSTIQCEPNINNYTLNTFTILYLINTLYQILN